MDSKNKISAQVTGNPGEPDSGTQGRDSSWKLSSWPGPANAEDARLLETPEDLLCPISKDLFSDPVLASSGHVYERAALERHLAESPLDPLSRQDLTDRSPTPVHAIRSRAADFRARTAAACLSRAADPGCEARACLLRRAAELLPPSAGGPAFLGLAEHRGPGADAELAGAFAEHLAASGDNGAAGGVLHALALESLQEGRRADAGTLLRRCLELWARAEGVGRGAAEGADAGVTTAPRAASSALAISTRRAEPGALRRLATAQAALSPLTPRFDDMFELARLSGLGREACRVLCDGVLGRPRVHLCGPADSDEGPASRAVTAADHRADVQALAGFARALEEEAEELGLELASLERRLRREIADVAEDLRRPPWLPVRAPAWLATPSAVTALLALSAAMPSADRLLVRGVRAAGTYLLCASLTR